MNNQYNPFITCLPDCVGNKHSVNLRAINFGIFPVVASYINNNKPRPESTCFYYELFTILRHVCCSLMKRHAMINQYANAFFKKVCLIFSC